MDKTNLPEICGKHRRFSCKHYRYHVGRGNNSRLILAAIRRRPWLVPHRKQQHRTPPEKGRQQVPKMFVWEMYRNRKRFKESAYNHLEGNGALVTKKGLHRTMSEYKCEEPIEKYMPITFWSEKDVSPEFLDVFDNQLWILKPASMSNRGVGIRVANSLSKIREIIAQEARRDARCGGWMIQRYIEQPLLVSGRKFDVRVFALLVTRRTTGLLDGYVHPPASYIRTSSEKFSLSPRLFDNRGLHLTNDGVQNKSAKYSKFEIGNKLTLDEFQAHLVRQGRTQPDWIHTHLWPRIYKLVAYTIDAAKDKLNPHRRKNCFELLGYDFMIDENLDVWLLEVNSNPCLDLCSPHLESELPKLIEDAMHVGLDHVLPPPADCSERSAQAFRHIQREQHGFVAVFPVDHEQRPESL